MVGPYVSENYVQWADLFKGNPDATVPCDHEIIC
jgi:hypothetical protein